MEKSIPIPNICMCLQCGKAPDIGVTGETDRTVLVFCIGCARKIADECDLPNLRAQLSAYKPPA